MIRVKVSSRGSGKDLDISQYVGNDDSRWGDCQFFVNTHVDEADVWFVSEDVDDDDTECRVPAGNVVFLTAETSWPSGYYAESSGRMDVLRQYGRIYTCHDIYLPTVHATIPFLPWMINANHGPSINSPHKRDLHWLEDLQDLDKPRLLSVFCSAQTMTPSHRLRLRFVEKLKEHFGDRIDWFGNGINAVDEKWDGIAPYRYTIVLENHAASNVITEKLGDAFLGLAYPIYWGAPNVHDYYPNGCLTSISIEDLYGSIETIERVISSDARERALEAILEAKRRVLVETNLYARMATIATELHHGREPVATRLATMTSVTGLSHHSQRRGILTTVGQTLNKMGDVLVRRGVT